MAWYAIGISAASMLGNMLMKSQSAPQPLGMSQGQTGKPLIGGQTAADIAQQYAQFAPQGANWGASAPAQQMPAPNTQSIMGGTQQPQSPSMYESIMQQWGQ